MFHAEQQAPRQSIVQTGSSKEFLKGAAACIRMQGSRVSSDTMQPV